MRYTLMRYVQPRVLEKYAQFLYWDSAFVYGSAHNPRQRYYCMVRYFLYSTVRESRVQGVNDCSRSFTPRAWSDECQGRNFTPNMALGMSDSIRVKIHEKKNQTSW